MTAPIFEITKAAQFDAAHSLDDGPADGRYRRLHGHSFRVEVSVRGPQQGAVGWVADLGALDGALKALAAELDHGLLNEKPGLASPTLENLCLWFAGRLAGQFPGLSRVAVARPSIGERCSLELGATLQRDTG
jgi:6-pyruvoyltetrahydropterin/6-carboxytetrahydropterin synthase